MTFTELLFSVLPIFIAIAGAVLVLRKVGVFEQRAHRERVEQLLERIAIAVEKTEARPDSLGE